MCVLRHEFELTDDDGCIDAPYVERALAAQAKQVCVCVCVCVCVRVSASILCGEGPRCQKTNRQTKAPNSEMQQTRRRREIMRI